jgi:hypothetical protein
MGSSAQEGAPDPFFSSVPFNQWLNEKSQASFHWTLRLSPPALSTHQRLAVILDARVDGAELARRRGEGKLVVLAQLTDVHDRIWQNHVETDLEHVQEGISTRNIVFSQTFFVIPGDYRLAVVVFDTATKEHSLARRVLHVAALKNDPLPGMWRELPAIEFVTPAAQPDQWFLPAVQGRLYLPVEVRRPSEISLLVNLTPPEKLAGSTRAQSRNLSQLVPATKVISEVEWHNAKLSLELLDLSRRRVTFQQDDMQLLDWPTAREALTEVSPGVIDVKSLANRRFSAEFFLNQVAEKIAPRPGPARPTQVLIVLSASVFFEPGVEMHPIGIAAPPDATVFYVRFDRPLPPARLIDNPDGIPPPRRLIPEDQLEPLLKPLSPRLFEVTTPLEFHRALATILAEIARL